MSFRYECQWRTSWYFSLPEEAVLNQFVSKLSYVHYRHQRRVINFT